MKNILKNEDIQIAKCLEKLRSIFNRVANYINDVVSGKEAYNLYV